jgi:hypothetical protein
MTLRDFLSHDHHLRNAISITGAVLTTITALLFVGVFVLDLFGFLGVHTNPYLGIIFFIVLPTIFVLALLLIPLGAWYERRRLHRGLPPSMRAWPRFDLNHPGTRAIIFGVAVLTPVNLMILGAASYKGLESMDSVAFCGQVCHEVMQPEFVAYQHGPHARVKCVECHIGEGASWFVKSKLSGARQVYAVLFNTHSRPIPSPVHDLRPARETCEQCHWPTQFHGDKVERIYDFADDEENTESVTEVQLRIGGVDATGVPRGIHWHVAEQNNVEYIALDDKRQEIAYVRYTGPDGVAEEYFAEGVTPAQLEGRERRRMDCVDCHNRPSHRFAPSAERAVNGLLSTGAASSDLPFLKREAVRLLKTEYPDQETGATAISNELRTFYRTSYPDLWTSRQGDIERAVDAVQGAYRRNVFPSMGVTFGIHPSNLGHMDSPGCFRCHDESHKSNSGKVIAQDCSTCHELP